MHRYWTYSVPRLVSVIIAKSKLDQSNERAAFDVLRKRQTLGLQFPVALQFHRGFSISCVLVNK